jgi:hypothetical protein
MELFSYFKIEPSKINFKQLEHVSQLKISSVSTNLNLKIQNSSSRNQSCFCQDRELFLFQKHHLRFIRLQILIQILFLTSWTGVLKPTHMFLILNWDWLFMIKFI